MTPYDIYRCPSCHFERKHERSIPRPRGGKCWACQGREMVKIEPPPPELVAAGMLAARATGMDCQNWDDEPLQTVVEAVLGVIDWNANP